MIIDDASVMTAGVALISFFGGMTVSNSIQISALKAWRKEHENRHTRHVPEK